MFQDYLLYATDVETRYAYRLLNMSELVEAAMQMHTLSLAQAVPLAETMIGSCLLASVLEDDERVNLRVQAGSEFTAASETTRSADTRAYIEFAPDSGLAEILDTESRIKGQFIVRSIRAHSQTQQLFQGNTQSDNATIEESIAEHITQSFQLNSKIKIQAWVDDNRLCAYGFILFELPNLAASVSEALHQHLDALPSLKTIVTQNPDPDVICSKLIPHATRPIKSLKPSWGCKCSQESVELMLLKLPPEELADMASDASTKVMCHYCSKDYEVPQSRIEQLHASSLIAASKVKH